ncbi:c-type cytochrome [Rhodoligotrophos defluvii]|uniref:c-type cytochrome n=1 Tax=Rhodoligotrophos defluvii TaxID=2561934 RepID=UPI0010C9471A|nr:c-type cytochrome [Rhodoligotrophos defluvii]
MIQLRHIATPLLLIVALAGCGEEAGAPELRVRGDPEAGAAAIRSHGCGICHTIPGIAGADATVGPPLVHYDERAYVAGVLPNTPRDLIRWIVDPPAVDPRTAMPELGVSEEEARDIAAYLYRRTGERK